MVLLSAQGMQASVIRRYNIWRNNRAYDSAVLSTGQT
jgi:hypothetical protein